MISFSLRVLLIVISLLLVTSTLHLVRAGMIPVRYSLSWIVSSAVLFFVGLIPNKIWLLTHLIGFETTSNMVIGVILFILLIVSLFMTMIVSQQHKTIILLIQEISLLKKTVDEIQKGDKL